MQDMSTKLLQHLHERSFINFVSLKENEEIWISVLSGRLCVSCGNKHVRIYQWKERKDFFDKKTTLYGIVSGELYTKSKTLKENILPGKMFSPTVSRLESILNFG